MELRALGCISLAYVSVSALFWLFDHHDPLVQSPAPASVDAYLRHVVSMIRSYALGVLAFAARAFGVKAKGLSHLPPPLQTWVGVGVLSLVGFLFSNVRAGEAFHLILWEHVGLFALIALAPLVQLARRRFVK